MPSSGCDPLPRRPIYIPGRLRICSSELSVFILDSSYWCAFTGKILVNYCLQISSKTQIIYILTTGKFSNQKRMQATLLTIAGSDPTGGAGLQADIKAMTVIGCYAAAVPTCITVQNSREVQQVEPLPPTLVHDQIMAVLDDHHVTHIKIGMVGTAAIAEAICTALKDYSGEIVIDPILLSTTGQELLPACDLDMVRSTMLVRATVMTPNLPELSNISGINPDSPEKILHAGDHLLEEFANLRAVLIKGGHAPEDEEVTDLLLYKSGGAIKLLSSTRVLVATKNTHGTGCILASAYTAFHSLTGDDEQAFFKSASFIQHYLEESKNINLVKNPQGRGGLLFPPSF